MANRTTRDKLKRVLAENCIRNNIASTEAIAEYFMLYQTQIDDLKRDIDNQDAQTREMYQRSIDSAEMIMMALAQIMEGYEGLSNFITKVNEQV